MTLHPLLALMTMGLALLDNGSRILVSVFGEEGFFLVCRLPRLTCRARRSPTLIDGHCILDNVFRNTFSFSPNIYIYIVYKLANFNQINNTILMVWDQINEMKVIYFLSIYVNNVNIIWMGSNV